MCSSPGNTAPTGDAAFHTTHWTVVLTAAQHEAPGSSDALEKLCQAYRYPLYAFIRRRGHTPEDAEDLLHGFFLHLLSGKVLRGLTREGAKFRAYLLHALKCFLANDWRQKRAAKRGGGAVLVSIDSEDEARYQHHETTPETLFERQWGGDGA